MEIPGLSIVPILFIVIIIVPGTFCKRFFFSGEFSNQFGSGVFADRLLTSIFWGLVINLITYLCYSKALGFNFNDFKEHLRDAYEALASNKLPKDLDKFNIWMILGYIASSIVAAVLSGILAHNIVRGLGIDKRFKVFRFSNHWHYYFTGEILKTNGIITSETRKKVVMTSADIVLNVDYKGKPKLFSGILSQYTLSPKGTGLESLILTEPQRYSEEDNCFKKIPGHVLIIPFEKVVDINLRYDFVETKQPLTNQERVARAAIVVVFALSLVIVLPWFLGLSFWATLAGIPFLLISWLTISIYLLFYVDREQRSKMSRGNKFTLLIIGVLSFCAAFIILNLKKPIVELYNYVLGY